MKNYILSREQVDKKIRRMAYEITEQNVGATHIWLAGIKDNGVVIAEKIQEWLKQVFKGTTDIIEIEVDDKRFPKKISFNKPVDLNNAVIVVVDDVANSGKTMLYVLAKFLAWQPQKIQTLALVDRTHKTFPVNTDYIGFAVATTLEEHIFVEVQENVITGAYLE